MTNSTPDTPICEVANPGGSPCTKPKGHDGGHGLAAYGSLTNIPILDDDAVNKIEVQDKVGCITGCRATERGVYHDPLCSSWQRAKNAQVIARSEIESIEDLHAYLVELCEQKATECDAKISCVPDQSVAFQSGKATAFREVVTELEQLK